MQNRPIEIRQEDIIRRGSQVVVGGSGPPAAKPADENPIRQMKEYLKDINALVKEVKESGIADALGLKLGGGKTVESGNVQHASLNAAPAPAPAPQGKTPAQIIQGMKAALILQYGDLPVEDILECLKRDYGKKKLSEL